MGKLAFRVRWSNDLMPLPAEKGLKRLRLFPLARMLWDLMPLPAEKGLKQEGQIWLYETEEI